jgi:hypothetical protein
LPPAGGDSAATTLEALERQTHQVDAVVIVGPEEDLHARLEPKAEWLWLLDGGVIPEPAALERLFEALARLDTPSPPVLLASKVVRPDGSLDPGSLPVPPVRELDFAVAACEQHLVAVRIARRGSLLVHKRGLEAAAPPRPGSLLRGGDLEWTARLLKHERGVLVPGSVAVRRTNGTRAPLEVAGRLRLLRGDGLEAWEKPWFALRLAEDAMASLRRR